jgi:hypothetical protein
MLCLRRSSLDLPRFGLCTSVHPSATACGVSSTTRSPHLMANDIVIWIFIFIMLLICFYFLILFLLRFVSFSLLISMWFYLMVGTFVIKVHSSSLTNLDWKTVPHLQQLPSSDCYNV